MKWAIQHVHQFSSFLSGGEPACTKPASKEPLPVLLKAADEVWDFGVFLSGVLPVCSPSSSSSSPSVSSSSLLHAWSKFWFPVATQWRQKFRHRALEMWWLWRHWRRTSENIRGCMVAQRCKCFTPSCNMCLQCGFASEGGGVSYTRHWMRCMKHSQSNHFQHSITKMFEFSYNKY